MAPQPSCSLVAPQAAGSTQVPATTPAQTEAGSSKAEGGESQAATERVLRPTLRFRIPDPSDAHSALRREWPARLVGP